MKLLILGGTVFLGRHLVDAALARGHDVTLFNRGQHNPDLYPWVERLRGDRDGALNALHGGRWDAAIDTCGYVPRIVRASAELLSSRVEHYTFVSTLSVYADTATPGIDESAPVGSLADETIEDVTGETYGPLKALCERAAEEAMPGRVLIPRPGLIVGPHDPTGRFTYWPARVVQGGEVLAPGNQGRPVQVIDARDLAEWTIRMIEDQQTGIYNATGPDDVLTMGDVLDASLKVSGSDARITWVDEGFLLDAGVEPWSDLPLWIPEGREMDGLMAVDCRKAVATGLTFRPIGETVRDTLAWDATHPREDSNERQAGLAPERERELLAAWRQRSDVLLRN